LVEESVHDLNEAVGRSASRLSFKGFRFGALHAKKKAARKRGGCMKTLVIGLVITIVFLATYFVSTMERVW
jgi:hypothetical protein